MLGIVGSTLNDRLVVEPGEPFFQLLPDAVETFCLCGERTASVLSLEDEPFIGKPWGIGSRHAPNPLYIIPSDRFSLSLRMFTGNLIFGHH
jgi:hypothetical protein